MDSMLTGTYERILDEKLRLALPKPLREVLGDEYPLILTPGTDGSLALFATGAFEALAAKLADRSPTAIEVRAFSRLIYSQSHRTEIDSQGRIRIPTELARLAGLDGSVVLLGVGDRIELWNKSRWDAYFADLQPRYDQLAESAFSEHAAAAVAGRLPADDVARPLQPR
jgi:MraZ protein